MYLHILEYTISIITNIFWYQICLKFLPKVLKNISQSLNKYLTQWAHLNLDSRSVPYRPTHHHYNLHSMTYWRHGALLIGAMQFIFISKLKDVLVLPRFIFCSKLETEIRFSSYSVCIMSCHSHRFRKKLDH